MTGKSRSRLRILPGLLAGCVLLTTGAFAQDPAEVTDNPALSAPFPTGPMTMSAMSALSRAADEALALARNAAAAAQDVTIPANNIAATNQAAGTAAYVSAFARNTVRPGIDVAAADISTLTREPVSPANNAAAANDASAYVSAFVRNTVRPDIDLAATNGVVNTAAYVSALMREPVSLASNVADPSAYVSAFVRNTVRPDIDLAATNGAANTAAYVSALMREPVSLASNVADLSAYVSAFVRNTVRPDIDLAATNGAVDAAADISALMREPVDLASNVAAAYGEADVTAYVSAFARNTVRPAVDVAAANSTVRAAADFSALMHELVSLASNVAADGEAGASAYVSAFVRNTVRPAIDLASANETIREAANIPAFIRDLISPAIGFATLVKDGVAGSGDAATLAHKTADAADTSIQTVEITPALQNPASKTDTAASTCTAACDVKGSAPERKSFFAANNVVKDGDLGGMRAGFFTAAGAQFDFGATVTTLVNGNLALQSTLNWTPTGLAVQQFSGSTPIAGMASDPLGQQAITNNGQTQAFSNLTNGQLQNFVVNSASNQNISQNTNVALTIYNFTDWQQQMTTNSVAAHLAADVMSAAGLAASH